MVERSTSPHAGEEKATEPRFEEIRTPEDADEWLCNTLAAIKESERRAFIETRDFKIGSAVLAATK